MSTHQPLICSYPPDYPFLIHCLASLKKFSRGFLPPVVGVHFDDYESARSICDQSFPEAEVKVYDGVEGHGFIRAQCMMMCGDIFCPNADFTWLLGSDCLVMSEFTPEPYFRDGKPVMLYTPYEILEKYHPQTMPWRDGTRLALGWTPPAEYMRRLPLIYPKQLFAPMRRHIAHVHNRTFLKYLESRCHAKPFNTSESNILGAYAAEKMPELYHWAEIKDWAETQKEYPNAVLQFWSKHPKGLDGKCDHQALLPSGRGTAGRTPREIINEVLYGLGTP